MKNLSTDFASPSRYKLAAKMAVRRGIDFICSRICDAEDFDANGFDYLFSLLTSVNSKDPRVRRRSQEIGKALSQRWVDQHPTIPSIADADMITELVFGSLSASQFGVAHSLRAKIQDAATSFGPQEYFWFDPVVEPPPKDIPEDCECGASNNRGERTCKECSETLDMKSCYEIWLDAMIRSYLGERYGVTLGARYADVLKWIPHMRPYPELPSASESDFIWSIYAITHITYTLNDYNSYHLDHRWLPCEFEALKNSLHTVIAMDDPETVGEILDCLKSYKVNSGSSLLQNGIGYLLSRQKFDGSWGGRDVENAYAWHHTTIAAVNGLDEYLWRGTRLSFPKLAPLLRQSACKT
jgi:hypothetical protein